LFPSVCAFTQRLLQQNALPHWLDAVQLLPTVFLTTHTPEAQ
jgi:hypothetical protein